MRFKACGSGEAILFIHGMPTNGRLWDGMVDELASRFRCFVIDLPGMGETPFVPYSASYFAQVTEQIEQVRIGNQVERWHLAGHDGGCAIAVQYAYRFPERVGCMALLSPAIFPDLSPFVLLELLRKRGIGEVAAPLIHALFWGVAMRRAIPGRRHSSQRASFHKTFSGALGPWKLMRLVRWGEPGVVLEDLPGILRSLGCFTLVVHGARDILPRSFAVRAATMIANSQLLEMESGHFIPIECAAEVAQKLLAYFLAQQERTVGESGGRFIGEVLGCMAAELHPASMPPIVPLEPGLLPG